MNELQNLKRSELPVRTFESGDGIEHVVDLGATEREGAVDVVDGTAIVVVDDEQHEIDVGPDAQAFIRNGVLTIRTEDSL